MRPRTRGHLSELRRGESGQVPPLGLLRNFARAHTAGAGGPEDGDDRQDSKFMKVCSACGQENPDVAKFCLACGAPLEAPAPAPSAEERKLVTVLFTDIVGSTAKAEQMNPVDVRARPRAVPDGGARRRASVDLRLGTCLRRRPPAPRFEYTDEEYAHRLGWGHSSVAHASAFARAAGVRRLAMFHHDPMRSDREIEELYDEVAAIVRA